MGELRKRTLEAPPVQATDSVNWDDEIPGFGIRFCASGRRSYIIQFRDQGRSRRFTIGGHGIWTPELARREAKVRLGRVARSDDPAEEQQLDDQAMPVEKPSQRYLTDLERGLILSKRGRPKKQSTVGTDTGRIRRDMIPLLGRRRVKNLNRTDTNRAMKDIMGGKTAKIVKNEKQHRKALAKSGLGPHSLPIPS